MREKSWKRLARASHTPTNGVQVAGVLPMRYATETKTIRWGPRRYKGTPLRACGFRDSLPQVQRQAAEIPGSRSRYMALCQVPRNLGYQCNSRPGQRLELQASRTHRLPSPPTLYLGITHSGELNEWA